MMTTTPILSHHQEKEKEEEVIKDFTNPNNSIFPEESGFSALSPVTSRVLYLLGDITSGPAFRFTQWLDSVRSRSGRYHSSSSFGVGVLHKCHSAFETMPFRYPHLSHTEVAESCPVCRGNCNCKQCLRSHGNYKEKHKSERKLNKDGEHNYSKYLVHVLLLVLKQIDQEQVMEKKVEAKIQEAALLTEMRKSLEQLGSTTENYSDAMLTRILVARSMNPMKAAKMLVSCKKWREEFVPLVFILDSEGPGELKAKKNLFARTNPNSRVLKPQFFREVYQGSPDVYSSQFPLAPPLPKSPSESWLWCTLPSVSSKNYAAFHSRKQCSKPPSVDQTWETIVKTSNVSEESITPLPQQSET